MIASLLADSIVLLHMVFILFALLGGFLGLWRRWILTLHFPAALWAALVEIFHWPCPLTPLENKLRASAKLAQYHESFIEHYLLPILYPAQLSKMDQTMLGMLVILVNIGIYILVNIKRRNL